VDPVADQVAATVDEYIESFPPDVQAELQELRRRLRAAAPGSGETISYKIPTITVGGRALVYFAGWKTYLSVYPVPAADESFERELAPYRAGKGTLRFPLGRVIPDGLIERLVTLLVEQRVGD